ncbi:hypothetical protein CgunFtcFv8_022736 [Champsocephalus gunnari]|uniref:Uncharacterized protein n=1 Tax=Champsocephalus gunnari TaxID=52237 RepID=A0AAN8DZK3_CHAGU|nr:hypothetical protein CgunFtcFv8_022736 [Champsocephalus gunnari]
MQTPLFSPPLTLLMGDSRVSLFGANYRLFGVGMALRLKAAEHPAPTAPNLRIKHYHPQSNHLGKLHCSLISPSLVLNAGGYNERATFFGEGGMDGNEQWYSKLAPKKSAPD